jgi:hypothetical protein
MYCVYPAVLPVNLTLNNTRQPIPKLLTVLPNVLFYQPPYVPLRRQKYCHIKAGIKYESF